MAAAVEQLWGDFPDLGAALAGDWALVQRGAGGGRIDLGQFVRNGDTREVGMGGAAVGGYALSLAASADLRQAFMVGGVIVGQIQALSSEMRMHAVGARAMELWTNGARRLSIDTGGGTTIYGMVNTPSDIGGYNIGGAMALRLMSSGTDMAIRSGTAALIVRNASDTVANLTSINANGDLHARGEIYSGGALFTNGRVHALADNAHSLGVPSLRWSVVYAGTGTISTSDEREKQDIRPIDDALLDAWGDVSPVLFRWKDAVAEKGEDARIHPGYIAQQVQAALAAHAIDGFAYGLLCYDEWAEEREPVYETRTRDVLGPVQVDTGLFNADGSPAFREEQGVIRQEEYQHDTGETRVVLEAGNRFGLRYSECHVIEVAYQRRRAARLEAQAEVDKLEWQTLIADLSARLAAFEAAA